MNLSWWEWLLLSLAVVILLWLILAPIYEKSEQKRLEREINQTQQQLNNAQTVERAGKLAKRLKALRK